MRKTLCASVLLLALCVPALAGDILTPPAPANSDDPPVVTQPCDDEPADVCGGTAALDPQDDVIGAAVMALLNSVSALL
ncbi:MAG TPA: hypothetical protein VF591_24560 [Pyrinomonadaceae bacterium]